MRDAGTKAGVEEDEEEAGLKRACLGFSKMMLTRPRTNCQFRRFRAEKAERQISRQNCARKAADERQPYDHRPQDDKKMGRGKGWPARHRPGHRRRWARRHPSN